MDGWGTLWVSNNGGANWARGNKYTFGSISAIAVAPSDSNTVAVGMRSGTIQLSDAALNTQDWSASNQFNAFISSITFDPMNKQTIYLTTSTFGNSHVWKTINGGSSWFAIDGSGTGALPDIPVNSIVVDPINPMRLFVGTDLGVFVTTNSGATWAIENTGFANAPVESLQLNTVNGVVSLYAFSHGRGVFRIVIGTTQCSFVLTSNGQSIGAAGGSSSVGITQSGSCNPTLVSNVNWITAASIATGKANFIVAPNTSTTERFGTISVAGKSYSIKQKGIIDTQNPIVKITTPTTALSTQTDSLEIELGGTVIDDFSVTDVQWKNSRSGLGNNATYLNGTWSARIDNLELGDNDITVIAKDASGNIGVASIRVMLKTNLRIEPFAGTGVTGFSGDGGLALNAKIGGISDITTDQPGNIYFVEFNEGRVRKISTNGIISTIAGTGLSLSTGDGGLAVNADVYFPISIAANSKGDLFVMEWGQRIRKITAATGIISTVITYVDANLSLARSLVIDRQDNILIANNNWHRITKVTPSGEVSIFAGTFGGYAGDGGLATSAMLAFPIDLTFDDVGNLFFTEGWDHIRKIATNGIISTVTNDTKLSTIATDKQGNVYYRSNVST